jgi:kinesin family protein C2/C3
MVLGRIRVYVRVRPLSDKETKAGYVNVLTKEDERTVVMAADNVTSSEVKDWEFDKIFSGTSSDGNTQEAVFNDTSLLITSAIDGFNVCIFAFGQTGRS